MKYSILRKSFFLITLFILLAASLFADPEDRPGIIKGVVTTSDNKPAANVTVLIKSTGKGVTTDENGVFEFRKIGPGAYTLQISLLGYETIEQAITVEENKTNTLAFRLKISNRELQEVTVRAARNPYTLRQASSSLRLNQPLVEAPQNIQIVTSRALADQQIISMSDGVLRNVSGTMRVEHWADLYTNVHMRGSQVSALRNGMNIATSYWSPLTEDMSVVDHIEFVKGPAGFLMPVGDPAGVYNVVTKRPTGVTKGEISFMTGSNDLYRGAVDLDGRLDKAGKLLYRFNLAGKTQNSFRPYEFNNRLVIAPVISYRLDENTILTAEYLLQKVKLSDLGSYYVFSTKGYGVLPRNFTTADPGLDPTHITDQSITVNLQHKINDSWKLTAQAAYLDYKQQGSDLWPAYVGEDSMVRGVSNWDAASTAKYAQAFVNGELRTGSIQHRIIAGFDVNDKEYMADWNQYHTLDTDNDKFSLYDPVYGNPPNGYPVFDRSKPLEQRAGPYGTISLTYTGIYVQDELGFMDNKLRLTLAGRYSYVKNNDYSSLGEAKKFTPRIGLSYSLDKNTAVYALFDQAFVPQTGVKQDHGDVKPLTGSNMEAGIKRDWMDGKWISTLSAFRILRNNVNSTDPSDPTGRFIVQLGQTRSTGIEFDLRGEIVTGLTLMANYALTDSKISKTDSSAASKATLGQKVPGFAKHTANAWLNYQIGSGALKGLGFSGGLSFQGERNTWEWGATAEPRNLPDYTKIDAGVFWENNNLRINFNLFNVADKFLYSGAAYGDYYYWQAEPGRNWRLGVSYRF